MINRIVYSFFTAPREGSLTGVSNWANKRAELSCIVLSVMESKKNFEEVALVTDDKGFDILVNQLGLEFTDVSLALNDINPMFNEFWSLGKVFAYQLQTKPFIHIDMDAILFKPLSEEFLNAPTFCQHKEVGNSFEGYYENEIKNLIDSKFVVPTGFGTIKYADNLGIVGFNDMEFLKSYCREAINLMNKNIGKWNEMPNYIKGRYCVVVEQYIYSLVAKNRGVIVKYLADDVDSDGDFGAPISDKGFTHIWGGKIDSALCEKVIAKQENLYSEFNTQITELCK